jgi:hypothetical protein
VLRRRGLVTRWGGTRARPRPALIDRARASAAQAVLARGADHSVRRGSHRRSATSWPRVSSSMAEPLRFASGNRTQTDAVRAIAREQTGTRGAGTPPGRARSVAGRTSPG